MNRFFLVFFLAIFAFLPTVISQKLKKNDKTILTNLQDEIRFLADDKLEGRRTGTPGEKLASDYIVNEFTQINLQPKGDAGTWLQSFPVYDGKIIKESTHLIINEKALELQKDYFPLPYSARKKAEGRPAIALQESGVPWFIDLKETLEENKENPHFDVDAFIQNKVSECARKGATAVLIYNTSKLDDNIVYDPRDKSETAAIPVIYLKKETKKKYLRDESASIDIDISVVIEETYRTGHNVIGFLDNGASQTVILGAHYDHLGYGEDGNSMYRGPEHLIHNGADDNASGTAALIELARMLKQSRLKKNNYLFIAFSGEELGLYGSKFFTEHPTVDLHSINYMFNMDMVGRLNDSSKSLTLGGYGTSPAWRDLIMDNDKKYFNFKFDSSGSGPSDYTSFYLKDIPVLFFFTGLHADYHRPTDDYDKINYLGELQIVKFIYSLLQYENDKGKLAFLKTREIQSGTNTRFKVTLGIMPDYTFSGSGVRVDGVSEGKPAQRAGLQVGDIIVRLGSYNVSSLETYMQALSKFNKGDKTTVDYKRQENTLQTQVTF